MLAYKGVAPGTHYASNEPKLGGFHGDNSQPTQIDDVIRHITAHSWPSAWVSVSMSFAVAADFATSGGMVYEVRLDKIGSADKTDPLAVLVSYSSLHTHDFLHDHDGHQDLIAGVGDPGLGATILLANPLRPGSPPSRRLPPPNVSDRLRALVFATRDAELLLTSVPSTAVGNVYTIP